MKKLFINWVAPMILSKVFNGDQSGKPVFSQLFLLMTMRKFLPFPLLILLFFRKKFLNQVVNIFKGTNFKSKI